MKRLLFQVAILVPFLLGAGRPAGAHTIDYLAANVSPAADFNGSSGNFTVVNPIEGGAAIAFSLTFAINTNGKTAAYPATVTFGSNTQNKPSGAADAVVSTIPACVFANSSASCTSPVTVNAPATAGNYVVRIAPTSGTGGKDGLESGGGVTVGFTVAAPAEPTLVDVDTALALSLGTNCLLYKAPTLALSAILTAAGAPLPNLTIAFTVDGQPAGSAFTDQNGVATVTFNSGLLTVGEHSVNASFAGNVIVGNNRYRSSQATATLGVEYVFLGYQQPINGDGSSVFNGKVIPVKIRISDYNGGPVTDADVHVFFGYITPAVTGTDNEATPVANTSGDLGNVMRYDPTANQYLFNWDESALANGTYRLRVDLAEGSCAEPHLTTLSLGKKK